MLESPATETHKKLSGLSVLVVDDHMLMRRLVTQQLKMIGFEKIETAINGQEALHKMEEAFLRGTHFDIVMLDWGMPVMTGIELLRTCRGQEKFNHMAFVMLTGECEQRNVLEALQAGATSYIVKPVSQETMAEKVRNVVEWLEKKHEKDVYLI